MLTSSDQLFALPDGRAISYHLSASPVDGPVVLLSNSLTGPFKAWDRVVPVLSAANFRVLRYNQPGHGASGAPADLASTTFASMADDVYALLLHLNIPKLHAWVGVSMGASTGIYFAAKYPGVVKKLVPCDTISCSPVNLGNDNPFAARVQGMRAAGNMTALIQGTMERWFGTAWIEANPVEAARMRSVMSETTMDGFETCCAALGDTGYDLRPRVEAAGRGCEEALVVVGEKDADLPVTMQELRAGLEKGNGKPVELKVIKNAGHVSFIDGFDQFCEVVVPFLQK
ncbi:alpha/beta-hydrolase [Thozetella sp. PMI_491]|nr:alpha/beta-hydrolase [Thozetella sp. PMI_491]